MGIFLIISSVLLGVVGQIFFKAAMMGKGCATIFDAAKCSFFSIHFYLGLLTYSLSLILWMKVLADNDLSFARSFAGAGYVVTAFAAMWLFGEHISAMRWLGIGLISLGIFFVAKT